MDNLVGAIDKINLKNEMAEEAKEDDGNLKWGMDMNQIYKLALRFYKGMEKF